MLHAVTLTYSSHEEDITLHGMHIRNVLIRGIYYFLK